MRRVAAAAFLLLLTLSAPLASAAPARPPEDEDEYEIVDDTTESSTATSKLLEIKPRPRPTFTIAEGPAKAYAEAKRLLARGQPAAALKALSKKKSELLQDREALLRGDALMALGDVPAARDAYLEALEFAQIKNVSVLAARGLVTAYGLQKEWALQLEYLDALLAEPRIARKPNLVLERALCLEKLDRGQEAAVGAWRLLVDYPTAKVASGAEQLLRRLKKRGIPIPTTTGRLELARIRNLVRSSALKEAEVALDALEKASPELARAIKVERAEIYRAERRKDDERTLLETLYGEGVEGREGIRVLMRLGQLAMARDDSEQAMAYFDALAAKYPKSREAPEAQFLAAWLPYNLGDYEVAALKFLEFARAQRRWPRRPEALWFAGWSAYLSNKDGLARRAFDQLLEEHPTSEMALYAHYWTGRIKEREGDVDAARASYREVLKIAPLSYSGHWAIARLEKLGERVALAVPPDSRRASLREVLELLGPDRPISVDRAIALHAADLRDEAIEELHDASTSLAKIRDTRGRVMIAEMLDNLGVHDTAYRFATAITQDGADLVSGKPYAWRAWRLAFPKAYWKEVEAAALAHDIDPLLVLSIMRTESSFRPDARSPVGARGLMQIMPGTAQQIGRSAPGGRTHAARFYQPASNIWLGAWYLRKLLDRYGGQVALAAGAYNAGPGAMDKWVGARANTELDAFIEAIPYRETRQYVRRVLGTYLVYKRLNAEPNVDLAWVVQPLAPPEGAVAF